MDYNKVEDAVFKKAMEVFKEGAAEFFGLNVKISAQAETEIKNIDIKTNAMDYLFYTDNDEYLHFEFQTTKKKEDLLIRQLIKKFKIVPEDYKKQLMILPQETIEIIGTEMFDMDSIEELKKYFNS
ncbi:hypothetical protein CLPUN_27360 [Clostridium puniceum]|uniref:DUF4351 domain-containing protein n=1 Tax=Clostridium puniceum TaxID=29367 RepID=A0A1S8TFG0_9CLOT|nr:DUF4351 domain-containing protein [Clostridium puniceum]OOM76349.1 hypothetical protein CLPUN_27360 [Clostridium puniceum]